MNRVIATVIVSTSLLSAGGFMELPKQNMLKKETSYKFYSKAFLDLTRIYASKTVEFEHLKAVTLAMMMLESGRGTSDLATKHYNFGGLKYRPEMKFHAKKIRYKASDGFDNYCKFDSVESFIGGFWAFLDRRPYKGWRDHAHSPESFVNFIAPIYCPYNPDYTKQVLSLLPEAKRLLANYEDGGYKVAFNLKD